MNFQLAQAEQVHVVVENHLRRKMVRKSGFRLSGRFA
jgi:hypothetical protein